MSLGKEMNHEHIDDALVGPNTRLREWCFTLNNYNTEDLAIFSQIKAQYLVVGKEIGKECNTPHLQGYVYFKDAKTFSSVKKQLGQRVHLGARYKKSSPLLASNYCKKDGDYEEYGELPCQGQRSDLTIVRDMVAAGGSMRDIVDVASSYQSVKMAEVLFKYKEKGRTWKPHVSWYWGPTGTGKTKDAVDELGENHYVAMSTAKWWEGYDAHENVLIDDMRGDFCKFHELLRILDRYACKVECKGGSRQFLAKRIIVTSCHPPELLFKTREDVEQLVRRIDIIKEYLPEDNDKTDEEIDAIRELERAKKRIKKDFVSHILETEERSDDSRREAPAGSG